jgi:iron complex outermembrane receptor protein
MKQYWCWQSAVTLSIGMVCGTVWAADYPTEQDYFQELPIVLSASRLSQPISETPNAMTVIDRNMITASGARNIADLFKLVPGMYVGYHNGHTPIVSYRGNTDAYARRMQVLLDGRSVYLPPFGEVDWSELPVDIADIERIEVVRGPSAASHGSNSVQGVINMLTRQASGVPKTQVSVRNGGAGISDFSARLGNVGENWDYRVTFASNADNGFDNKYSNGVVTLNDSSTRQLINTRINYRMSGSNSFDFQLGYSDNSRQLGDSPSAATSKGMAAALRNQKTISDHQQITWLHTIEQNSDIQLSYYHIGRNTKDERYSDINAYSPTTRYLFADNAIVHRHDLELQHTLHTSANNRVVWGMGARRDSVTASTMLPAPITWREYRLFAHDEWRITPSDLLNIGAMVEKNAQGVVRTSPRVSYNHHLSERHTLRASLSVAYRNPEMIEELGNHSIALTPSLYGRSRWRDILSRGGLSPEHTLAREVGYIGQLDDVGSTLDVRAFHDQISDIIWVDPIVDATSILGQSNNFKSDFNATYTGLEGTLNYKLGVRSNLTVNYAHMVASARATVKPTALTLLRLQQSADGMRDTVPLNSASFLLSHDLSGGMQLGVGFYHIDPVRIKDGGTTAIPIQPLTRYLDLRVAQRFGGWRNKKGGTSGGEIAMVMQNALNDNYTNYNQDIKGKRCTYITATLEF